MAMVDTVATRSTCPRRSVGCVLVNSNNRVVSTGYNGTPPGFPHCGEMTPGLKLMEISILQTGELSPEWRAEDEVWTCGGENYKSGEGLDKCWATHAEVNAFTQVTPEQGPFTAYFNNATPCFTCAKMCVTYGVKRIVARDWYAHEGVDKLFKQAGVVVVLVGKSIPRKVAHIGTIGREQGNDSPDSASVCCGSDNTCGG